MQNNRFRQNRFRPSRRFQPPRHDRPSPPARNPEQEAFLAKSAIDPRVRFKFEDGSSELCARALDILTPVGKGQRGLIVSPPKAGKTTFLKIIAQALAKSDPTLKIYCLLVDERPEEITDFKRNVSGIEVHASSNDRPYEEHIRVAQNLMTKVIAEVNTGKDVVILLDSLTRLARVHNTSATGNRTMSGGLDTRALEIPRRFFGMARNLEEGGSLTILATILVGTGSRMDDIIFQEFKGTGNMELVLSRPAAEQRIFPALNIHASGTRKEELLLPKEELDKVYKLRRALSGQEEVQAASLFVDFLRKHETNAKALATIEP